MQFVLNHEEGGENCVLDGDPASETFLSEIIGAAAFPMRHMSMESLFEYGSRAGLWRVLRAFEQRRLPLTVFAVARALQRHSEAARRPIENSASRSPRTVCAGSGYQQMDEATERAHLEEAVAILTGLTGSAPLGWYTGRDSPNTRRLVVQHGGFLYDSDSYADDLPYWSSVAHQGIQKPHLIVPYTLDSNDMRFAAMQGFNSGTQFFDYLKDTFDTLYREGDPSGLDQPKMFSGGSARAARRPAGTHRFVGTIPGLHRRARQGLGVPAHRHRQALDGDTSVRGHGIMITLERLNHVPAPEFGAALAAIFEHSPWVAECVAELRPFDSTLSLHAAMSQAVMRAPEALQMSLILAHPELAGRAAQRGELTKASTGEQRGAGLDALEPGQLERLTALNRRYRERFRFSLHSGGEGPHTGECARGTGRTRRARAGRGTRGRPAADLPHRALSPCRSHR